MEHLLIVFTHLPAPDAPTHLPPESHLRWRAPGETLLFGNWLFFPFTASCEAGVEKPQTWMPAAPQ